MYIYKNALENLWQNKSRNILISIIIFVIVAATVVALIINNTASSVIGHYSTQFGSKVTISVNLQKLLAEAAENNTNGQRQSPQAPLLTPEMQLSFANSTALQKTEAYGYAVATAMGIKAVAQIDNGRLDNCRIYGDFWQDFTDGTRTLIDDGMSVFPSAPNECIISQDLCDLNGIKIGDTITFDVLARYDIPDDIDMSGYSNRDTYSINGYDYTIRIDGGGNARALRNIKYELIVRGVYYDMNDEYSGGTDINRRNEILTTLDTLVINRAPDEDTVVLAIKTKVDYNDIKQVNPYREVIPDNEYGAGTLSTVETGHFEVIDWPTDSSKIVLHFPQEAGGQYLVGTYYFVKTKENNYIFGKKRESQKII